MAEHQRLKVDNVLDYVFGFIEQIWTVIKYIFWFMVKNFGLRDAGYIFIGIFVLMLIVANRSNYYQSLGVGRDSVQPYPTALLLVLLGLILSLAITVSFFMGVVALGMWLIQPA